MPVREHCVRRWAVASRRVLGVILPRDRDPRSRTCFGGVFEEVEAEMIEAVVRAGADEPNQWRRLLAGIRAFLDACTTPRYRRIALEEGPAALGWNRWREIDHRYSLRLVRTPLAG